MSLASIPFASLPDIGDGIDGGTFAGLTTKKDGTHCAVILLPSRGTDLPWEKAMAWAKDQGGELPTRPVAALLFANLKDQLPRGWNWTSDECDASYAWSCGFGSGNQHDARKSSEGSAVAVRLIPMSAWDFSSLTE